MNGMNLKSYIKERAAAEGRSVGRITARLADSLDISVVSIHRYMQEVDGELARIPSRDIMRRIKVVTKGAVQPNDFY